MKRITDKDFRYTCAAKTNLHQTFARIRRELKAANESKAPVVRLEPKKARA